MRRLPAAAGLLSVLVMTGCPSEFGKDGRIAKAVHDDAQEQLIPPECAERKLEEICGPGKEDSEECRRCRQAGEQ